MSGTNGNGGGDTAAVMRSKMLYTRPERRTWELDPTQSKEEQLLIRAERVKFLRLDDDETSS
jgi:hypothetical protein